MKGFFELLYEEPTKLMILGASCSVVSQPVAETSQHWNLVQVSNRYRLSVPLPSVSSVSNHGCPNKIDILLLKIIPNVLKM